MDWLLHAEMHVVTTCSTCDAGRWTTHARQLIQMWTSFACMRTPLTYRRCAHDHLRRCRGPNRAHRTAWGAPLCTMPPSRATRAAATLCWHMLRMPMMIVVLLWRLGMVHLVRVRGLVLPQGLITAARLPAWQWCRRRPCRFSVRGPALVVQRGRGRRRGVLAPVRQQGQRAAAVWDGCCTQEKPAPRHYLPPVTPCQPFCPPLATGEVGARPLLSPSRPRPWPSSS